MLVCIVSILSCLLVTAQVGHICEARVVDANTGEALPMAVVRSGSGASTVANADGYFKLSAQPVDSLTVSFVGYRPQTLPVAGLGEVVGLVPGNVVLENVDVRPLGKRIDGMVKAAVERMEANADAASNFFYRQTTRVDGNMTSMVEAFFKAKSAFAVRDLMLITGRYSDDEVNGGVMGHSANLLALSELSMVSNANRPDPAGFISPVYWNYARYYDLSYSIIEEGGRTVYAVRFSPKEECGRLMAFDGTVYMAPVGNELLRVEGRVRNVTVLSNFGERHGKEVKADVRIYVDYDNSPGFSSVRTLRVEAEYDNNGAVVNFSSLMYNVGDMALAGEKKAHPATDLRRQIDKAGYDAAFWKRTEIVKRTKGEEWLAHLKDAESGGPVDVAVERGPSAVGRLEGFVKDIEAFNGMFPQEKVYLHFDNTAYFRGETLWFSAYVVRCDRQRLTDMSRVLYVEMLDPTGEVIETRKVRLDGGRGSGSIRLDKLLASGFYEVRAYTRYMLNWDAAWMFSRVFPVFDAPKEAGDYGHPSIIEADYRKRLPSARQKDSVGRETLNVGFYPESGRLVAGVPTRVAFAVTDIGGRPFDTGGELVAAGGEAVAVETLREGRGVFDYTPSQEPATLRLYGKDGRQHEFALPAADAEGCVMSVDATGGDYINVTVRRSDGFAGPLALVLVSGGNVDATDIIAPTERTARRRFSKADMAPGVSQLAVISEEGHVVVERMVFVYPRQGLDSIVMKAEGTLSPFGKLTLDMKTLPGTTLSVAVRDAAGEVNGSSGDAATWLLLTSDLRGYIHCPEYYLEADDEVHRRAVDLLMMVQGWRRYELPVMMRAGAFGREHPIEDGLYLSGRLYHPKTHGGVNGAELTATLYNRVGDSMDGTARTDSAGCYVFRLPDCDGEWTLLMNAKYDGEASGCRICIDRNFSPAARLLSPLETMRTDAYSRGLLTSITDSMCFTPAGQSMDERTHILRTVEVKGKRLFVDARAAWESERRGAFWSGIRYDCGKAADEIYDRGGDMPSVFEWLAGKNSFFAGSVSEMESIITNVPDSFENNHDRRVRERNKDWIPSSLLLDNISDRRPGDAIYFQGERFIKGPKYVELFYKERDLGHQLFSQTGGLSYKNRPVVWILNNAFYTVTQASKSLVYEDFDVENINGLNHEMMPQSLDDFKSVYISEDDNVWRQYITIRDFDRHSPVTVFLYSHHSPPVKHKGQRQTYFEGYSRVETFNMPDYSVMPREVDHRRTLYWNPEVKADGSGRATVELYNNSSCRSIVVSAEGMTPDGRAVVYK